MSRFSAKSEASQKSQNEALQILEEGLKTLTTSEDWRNYLKAQSAFHTYSFTNCLMIATQCPNATRVAGYQKWRDLGRQVQKGAKGIRIFAPITHRQEDTETGESRQGILGFRTISVFDISQTDGEALPIVNHPLSGDDAGLYTELKTYALSLGIKVIDDAPLSDCEGYCRYRKDKPFEIAVDSQLAPLAKAGVMAHELGHAHMHSELEYRQHSNQSQRELEAESVAFILLHHFGLDSGVSSFPYIATWSGGGEEALTQLKQSGQLIQRTAAQIIKGIDNIADAIDNPVPVAA
jgi:hypothetical protein